MTFHRTLSVTTMAVIFGLLVAGCRGTTAHPWIEQIGTATLAQLEESNHYPAMAMDWRRPIADSAEAEEAFSAFNERHNLNGVCWTKVLSSKSLFWIQEQDGGALRLVYAPRDSARVFFFAPK